MISARIFFLGLLALLWSWLSYDHYNPWVNFHSDALALFGLGLLWLGHCVKRQSSGYFFRGTDQLPRWAAGLLALALLPWLGYALGLTWFVGDAVLASVYLAALAAALCLGFVYTQANSGISASSKDTTALTGVFYMLWMAALLSAAIGLLQWLQLQAALGMYVMQTAPGDRAMGNMAQPNQLATLLLMGMVALAWTFERRRIGWPGLVVGVLFMSVVLVLTSSRTALLSTLVMGIFLILKSKKNVARIAPYMVLVWVVSVFLMAFMLPSLQDFLFMDGGRPLNLVSDSPRITIWKQMLHAIAQSPWVGYGWNQTPTAHAAGSLAVPGDVPYYYAHNVVLDLLAWNGLPVGLAIVGTAVYWWVSRMLRATGDTAVYAMAGLLPFGVHSMLEFPFAYAYFLVPVGLLAGMVEASYPGVKTFALGRRWLASALLLAAVVGSYMVYEYALIEQDYGVVRYERLRIGHTSAEYEVPHIRLFSQMGAMLDANRQKPRPGMRAQELEALRKVALRFAYGGLSLQYALALGLNRDPEGATRQMAVIRGMYGPFYYRVAVDTLRELEREKYPELAQVRTP